MNFNKILISSFLIILLLSLFSAINNQYKKYLSNKLKKSFHLEDIPIKVRFKKTNNPYE